MCTNNNINNGGNDLRHRSTTTSGSLNGSSPNSNGASVRSTTLTNGQKDDDIINKQMEQNQQQPHSNSIYIVEDKSIIEKLFSSKEEKYTFHSHKILGFSCLISFIYRFSYIGWEYDGNFGPTIGTLLFILHHWLLNISAFIFDIPHRRIKGGFRIWPEYRIHSCVFASRHLACILLRCIQQWNQHNDDELNMIYHIGYLIVVLATMMGADYGSYLQKDPSPTIRGTDYSDPFGQWFASEMQFLATASCLCGYPRYTMQLVVLAIIQINSFLMTLRRKNVASHFILTSLYGIMLIGAFWINVYDDQSVELLIPVCTFGQLGVILRMGPLRLNKYILWTGLWFLWNMIRYYNIVEIETNTFWIIAFFVTKTISILLGLQRRAQQIKGREDDYSSTLVQIVLFSYAALFLLIVVENFILDY